MRIHGPNGRYVNDTKIIEAVAQMFARIGIETDIETLPPANFFTRASTGGPNNTPEFSFVLVGWGSGTGEHSDALKAQLMTFDREKGTGSANRGRYSNPVFDQKMTEALATVDDTKRAALLAEATDIAMKDVGMITTHFQINLWAVRQGFKMPGRTDEYTMATSVTR
jgi:peptide/nickel transport system substrate-binding protein